jgi:Gpi18-like mannosyltransferase
MSLKKLVLLFLTWRIFLFIFLFLAIPTLTLQQNFLGWGLVNYLKSPQIWSWANYDGEHYLLIAQFGYSPFLYFFFPVYPLLIRYLASFFQDTGTRYAISGLLISNISFFLGLVGLVKLLKIDFSSNIIKTCVLLILLFPTSFFLASLYSESLFFALTIWTLYFARTKSWVLAGILGAIAGATRIIGITLLPVLLIELLYQRKDKNFSLLTASIGIILISLGLLVYMYFLKTATNDPLAFFTQQQGVFGEQRSANLILLPQVFYRYVFKILPSVNYSYFPGVFSVYFEFITAIIFLGVSLASFFELRLSYATYLFLGYLIPTLTGSFYSLPRFVIVLFPAFLLAAKYLNKTPTAFKLAIYTLLFILLGISTALFVRGYWIS